MKEVKLLLTLFVFIFSGTGVWAQDELNEAQKKQFQNRVKQKVEEFQHSLSAIVNKQLSHDVRRANVKSLLDVFIAKGDPYDYYDMNLDQRVHSTGVKMQTSSTNSKYNRTQKLKGYIYKLYDPQTGLSKMHYDEIIIESASAVRVDNIEKVGDHYECVAYFTQKFIGLKDGKVFYSDKTSKKIRCYITHMELPTGKRIFEAKLGDIYVLSTKRF